jgi:hypothetical protein
MACVNGCAGCTCGSNEVSDPPKTTYQDDHGDERCSACGQYVDLCEEQGCNPTKEDQEQSNIMEGYEGPDNPDAYTEEQIKAIDEKFRLAHCLHELVSAAALIHPSVIQQMFIQQFDDFVSLEFGRRSLIFTCGEGNKITFTQSEDGEQCTYEAKMGSKPFTGVCSDAYDGLSHKQIFGFYFDEKPSDQ